MERPGSPIMLSSQLTPAADTLRRLGGDRFVGVDVTPNVKSASQHAAPSGISPFWKLPTLSSTAPPIILQLPSTWQLPHSSPALPLPVYQLPGYL